MTDVIAGREPARLARRHPSLAHLRRRSGVLIGALTLMLGCAMALAPAASASPPVSIPAPIGNTNTYPAGIACPFTLQGTLIGGNHVLTFFDDGRFLATDARERIRCSKRLTRESAVVLSGMRSRLGC